MQLRDGRIVTGVVIDHRNHPDPQTDRRVEHLVVVNAQGEASEINVDDLESRQDSKQSLMPQDLLKTLSIADIRDLLALLSRE